MANKLTQIKNIIYEIRGQKVMLDSDLSTLYEVETFNLNKAVKRNIERFPNDFMFQLTKDEWENLIFQNGISSKQHGGRRFMPYVFTEHGVLMLSNVLNSETELHKLLMLHIKNNDYKFSEYDETIRQIVQALNNLVEQPKKTRRIRFNAEE